MSSFTESTARYVPLGVAAATGALVAFALASAFSSSDSGKPGDRRLARLGAALLAKFGGKGKVHMRSVPAPELRERGHGGATTDRRMFFQLRVLEAETPALADNLIESLKSGLQGKVDFVLYRDAASAGSIGLLVWTENPKEFATDLAQALAQVSASTVGAISERPGWTMTARSYANGHERDLEDFLLKKPVRTVLEPESEWAVWYPMRRRGEFYLQPGEDQCEMLLHHAAIGKSYGDAGAAHDVRLKCFGIDEKDNEFVIGLIGKDLFALSRIVEDLRKTRHTSTYMQTLGPFFVGLRIASGTKQASSQQ